MTVQVKINTTIIIFFLNLFILLQVSDLFINALEHWSIFIKIFFLTVLIVNLANILKNKSRASMWHYLYKEKAKKINIFLLNVTFIYLNIAITITIVVFTLNSFLSQKEILEKEVEVISKSHMPELARSKEKWELSIVMNEHHHTIKVPKNTWNTISDKVIIRYYIGEFNIILISSFDPYKRIYNF